jgi:hypothetical protein
VTGTAAPSRTAATGIAHASRLSASRAHDATHWHDTSRGHDITYWHATVPWHDAAGER